MEPKGTFEGPIYTVKVPFEAALLIEAAVDIEGHSLVECVCIKIQQSI